MQGDQNRLDLGVPLHREEQHDAFTQITHRRHRRARRRYQQRRVFLFSAGHRQRTGSKLVSAHCRRAQSTEWAWSPETYLHQAVATLAEDEENPLGPKRARYTLNMKYLRELLSDEDLALWMEDNQVDLMTVDQWSAIVLGEAGIILPLDQLIGADGPTLMQSFYPVVLEQYRRGALYALPLDALPLMLNYFPGYFKEEPLPPDGSWDWDDLVESARED